MENDLISRKALLKWMMDKCALLYERRENSTSKSVQFLCGHQIKAFTMVIEKVNSAPTIEAEPVRTGRWVLETNSGYRDSYFEDYILVVSIAAKCSECGENYGRTGHVYGDEFMGEEDGERPVENVEEKIEQTRNKYLDWLRSGRCKLMNYCPNCGAKMDAKEDA